MITYVTDKSSGRIYAIVSNGETLVLSDVQQPELPPVVIRLAELFSENRFVEVASTSDVN